MSKYLYSLMVIIVINLNMMNTSYAQDRNPASCDVCDILMVPVAAIQFLISAISDEISARIDEVQTYKKVAPLAKYYCQNINNASVGKIKNIESKFRQLGKVHGLGEGELYHASEWIKHIFLDYARDLCRKKINREGFPESDYSYPMADNFIDYYKYPNKGAMELGSYGFTCESKKETVFFGVLDGACLLADRYPKSAKKLDDILGY